MIHPDLFLSICNMDMLDNTHAGDSRYKVMYEVTLLPLSEMRLPMVVSCD